MAVATNVVRGKGHWAKRPLPEPPRSRRISQWSNEKRDEVLEEWLREQSVSNTYDAD